MSTALYVIFKIFFGYSVESGAFGNVLRVVDLTRVETSGATLGVATTGATGATYAAFPVSTARALS